MNRNRILPAIGLALLALPASAHPQYTAVLNGCYKPSPKSRLATSACATCHVGMSPALNPYGKDLKKALATLKTKNLTVAALRKVESLDSDKDGVKNGAELKAGTLPGDPKSKPAKK
ncbi:MAG TPA: hypothetical protein VGM37_21720 [Armatimonadota bacterium]